MTIKNVQHFRLPGLWKACTSILGLFLAILGSLSFQAPTDASEKETPSFWLEKAEVFSDADLKDSAVIAYKHAIQAAKKKDDLELYYYAYWDWQAMVFEQSLVAGRILEEALKNAWRKPRDAGEWEALCYVHCNRAYHLFQTGQLLPSVQQYNEAYTLYQQFRFPEFPVIEYLYKPLGAHYVRLGDGPQARLLLAEALRLANTPAEKAGLWNNLGLSYWDEGMVDASDSCFNAGLSIPNVPAAYQQLLRSGLAQLAVDQRNWQKAKVLLSTVQNISGKESEGSALWTDALIKSLQLQAQVALAEKDSAQALLFLNRLQQQLKSLEHVSPRTKGRYLLASAKLYQALGETAQVRSLLEALFLLLFQQKQITVTDHLEVYAESLVRDLLEFIGDQRLANSPEETVTAYVLACKTDLLLRSAYSFNSSRIKVQQAMRKNIESGLKELAHARLDPALNGALAWRLMEYGKSLMLLESQQVWAERDTSKRNLQKGLLLKEQAWLTAELALTPKSDPDKVAQLTERFKANVLALSKYAQSDVIKIVDAAALPALLEKSKTDLWLNTFAGKDNWYFLAFSMDHQPILKFFSAKESSESLHYWQRSVSGRTQGTVPEIPFLSNFISSLLTRTDVSRNMLISADGELGNIPWAAIRTNAGYLMERATLKFAFSASVWKEQLDRSKVPIQEVVGFAPYYSSQRHGLPPLQFSNNELEALPAHAIKYTDGEAQLNRLRQFQNKQAWIHLSTHGWTDTSGKSAAIAFYDSLLIMHDLFQWSFPGTVFVLSACETYKGTLLEGEGVMSMARQLAQAGANGMITTLWKVNEKSTGYIFESFYKQLQRHPPSHALRLAQLAYLNDPAIPAWEKTPYYWAGLMYVGVDQAYSPESAFPWYWVGAFAIGLLLLLYRYANYKKHQPGSTPS